MATDLPAVRGNRCGKTPLFPFDPWMAQKLLGEDGSKQVSFHVWQISGPEPSTSGSVAVPHRGPEQIPSPRSQGQSPGHQLPAVVKVPGRFAPRWAFTEQKAGRKDGSPGPLWALKA